PRRRPDRDHEARDLEQQPGEGPRRPARLGRSAPRASPRRAARAPRGGRVDRPGGEPRGGRARPRERALGRCARLAARGLAHRADRARAGRRGGRASRLPRVPPLRRDLPLGLARRLARAADAALGAARASGGRPRRRRVGLSPGPVPGGGARRRRFGSGRGREDRRDSRRPMVARRRRRRDDRHGPRPLLRRRHLRPARARRVAHPVADRVAARGPRSARRAQCLSPRPGHCPIGGRHAPHATSTGGRKAPHPRRSSRRVHAALRLQRRTSVRRVLRARRTRSGTSHRRPVRGQRRPFAGSSRVEVSDARLQSQPGESAMNDRTKSGDAVRVVVVGNGMVGHRFCDELTGRDERRGFDVACFAEEARPAYDRVHLSELFAGTGAPDLELADRDWYRERGIALHLAEPIVEIDRDQGWVVSARGRRVAYDALVLATGSAPFVPAIPGTELPGVFVYRTIDDLEAIRAWSARARRAAVIGGGLLGLEAAKAAVDLGLETHVVEFAARLMPRQVDGGGGDVLRAAIERLGVRVHVSAESEAIVGDGAVAGLRLKGGVELPVELVIVSAGIRPRDELARAAGLAVGPRGGIVVDTGLATSDPRIFAIGESALASGMVYGLVAPGYEMARTLAARLCGEDRRFTGADLSTKLKLLGVDVASFGNPFADEALGTGARRVVFEDRARGVYQKLVLSAEDRRLLGGILVGDA